MRMFYVANVRFPSERAHSIQIAQMCEAFGNNGVNLTLIVSGRKTVAVDPYEYFGIKRSFNVVKLAVVNSVGFGYFGYCLETLSFTFSLYKYLSKLERQEFVVYSRDLFPLIAVRSKTSKLYFEGHRDINWLLGHLLLPRLAGIVAISHGLLKEYQKRFRLGSERLLVAPDGIDVDKFILTVSKPEVRKKLNLPLDKKIVMYIGGLEEWKGVGTFLEASKGFLGRDVVLAVIGGDELEVSALKNKYQLVRFLGRKPYKDLPLNQRAADVLVVPNSGKCEISRTFTSPLKLFAHMASGVPLIVSDLPSMREIASEEQVYYFKPDDKESLAQAISMVMNRHPEDKKKENEAIRNVVRFSWAERAETISKFINN